MTRSVTPQSTTVATRTVLTFDRDAIAAILAHSQQAKDRSPTYGQEAPVPPGAMLVSDNGIYIMSNGRNAKGQHGWRAHPVAYAHQCNPDTMPFDDWWAVKSRAFGGSDHCEFLDEYLLHYLCRTSLATIGVIVTDDEIEFVQDPA